MTERPSLHLASIIEKRNALYEAHQTISDMHGTSQHEQIASLSAQVLELAERVGALGEVGAGQQTAVDIEAAAQHQAEEQRAEHDAEIAALKSQLLDANHRLLTVRDHAIGAEATAATAAAERDKAVADRHQALHELATMREYYERRYHELGGQAHDLSQQLHAVKHSQRWIAGGLMAAPVSGLRRAVRRARA